MNVRLVRNGELPPGVVDGYCVPCSQDVLVSGPEYACPQCDVPVHPDSLPRDARLAALGERAPKPAEPRVATKANVPAARPKAIKPTREALVWDRATDALLAATEQRVADLKAVYEQAKADHEQAAQELHWLQQLRGALTVDAAPALATTPAASTDSKPWARKHAACVNCGTTRIKHAANGRCGTCDSYWSKHRQERPIKETQNNGN